MRGRREREGERGGGGRGGRERGERERGKRKERGRERCWERGRERVALLVKDAYTLLTLRLVMKMRSLQLLHLPALALAGLQVLTVPSSPPPGFVSMATRHGG